MGIVDDYLKANDDKTSSAPVDVKSGSLIDQYLAAPDSDRTSSGLKKVSIVKPPISGATKEQSDEINAEPSKVGGANPRDSALAEGIKNLPSNLLNDSINNFKAAGGEIGSGVSDIVSNKSATGVGKVGLGVLSGLSAIPSAIIDNVATKPATEITGSPDIGDRVGLIAGAAIPLVPSARAVSSALPKNKALKTLVDSIGIDKLPDVVRQMKENPRLTPADLSPKVKQDTQNLFVTDGPHVNYLANTVEQRLASAKGAVENAMDTHLGGTVNAADKIDQLSNNIKKVGATQINPVLKATKPVDLTPVIDHIDSVLKPGVTHVISNPENMLPYDKVQKMMQRYRDVMTNDKTVLTNPDVLNKLQSGMRRNAEGLLKSIDPEAKAMGHALYQLREKVIDAVGKAGPQTIDKEGNAISYYRAGLSKYRDENHIADALEEGHDSILTNSKQLLDRPEFFKRKVAGYTAEEKEAAKEGARIAIDTQINGFKHAARRGTDVGEVDFNRQRIEALFGKEEAEKLFTKLTHERAIADTNNKLVQGSQTAMRTASKEAFALPTPSDVGKTMLPAAVMEGASMLATGQPLLGSGAYLGAKGVLAAKDAVKMALARNHNARYAKYALPTEGPDRDQLIQSLDAIANRPPKQSLIRRGAGALAKVVQP